MSAFPISDLRTALQAASLSVGAWQFPDVTYQRVSRAFVETNWQAWMDSRPPELTRTVTIASFLRRVPLWVSEAGDCDNLALGTMAWADVGNALASVRRGVVRGGLAYGVIFYVALGRSQNYNINGPHAINWFWSIDSGEIEFFEPGVGEFVDLNSNERASAWFGLAV